MVFGVNFGPGRPVPEVLFEDLQAGFEDGDEITC